jgi:putative sigma-54 modulation protein
MNIKITGKHIDVTPAIKELIHEKVSKITNHFDRAIRTEVTIEVANGKHIAEIKVFYPHKNFSAHAETNHMNGSVIQSVKKILGQMRRDKTSATRDNQTIRDLAVEDDLSQDQIA